MPRIRINNIKADIETPEEEVLNTIRQTLPANAKNLQLVKKSLDARTLLSRNSLRGLFFP